MIARFIKRDKLKVNQLSRISKPLKRHVVSEKTTLMQSQDKPKYVFVVDNSLNKFQIHSLISSTYNVNVEKVNVICVKGKRKRFRGIWGVRPDIKKAIVTLAQGQSINMSQEA